MRRVAGILLAMALLTGAAACGDDGDKDESNGQEATEFGNLKPEDVRASPAEVADGFREIDRYADDVVAKLGSDDNAAAELQERLLTIWESILGSVKANDEAAYSKLDEALKVLMSAKGSGDKAKAEDAAETVEDTAAAYLEEFPASGSGSSTGSPSPDSTDESDTESDGESDVESDVESGDPPLSY
jgi:hypothetical protein